MARLCRPLARRCYRRSVAGSTGYARGRASGPECLSRPGRSGYGTNDPAGCRSAYATNRPRRQPGRGVGHPRPGPAGRLTRPRPPPLGQGLVPLGVHLGHVGPRVPEQHLGGLQPEHPPHLGGDRVPELVRVPVRPPARARRPPGGWRADAAVVYSAPGARFGAASAAAPCRLGVATSSSGRRRRLRRAAPPAPAAG